jgi:ABC-2 type transport system permease protein
MKNPLSALRRIRGIFRRHLYLWFHLEYFFDTFWQPLVEVFIWGFVSYYLSKLSPEMGKLVSFFLGAVVLWAMLRRGQHEITFTMMEEAWSRNLQNILITPLNMIEYFIAAIGFGMVKLTIEITFMGLLIGTLFGFNILTLGWTLIPFAVNLLLTGWAIGLVVNAAIIYFGRGLVALSWIMAFVLQPFPAYFTRCLLFLCGPNLSPKRFRPHGFSRVCARCFLTTTFTGLISRRRWP